MSGLEFDLCSSMAIGAQLDFGFLEPQDADQTMRSMTGFTIALGEGGMGDDSLCSNPLVAVDAGPSLIEATTRAQLSAGWLAAQDGRDNCEGREHAERPKESLESQSLPSECGFAEPPL
jgi:hypothetical protein